MTVGEVIKELEEFPKDLEVWLSIQNEYVVRMTGIAVDVDTQGVTTVLFDDYPSKEEVSTST